jgi:hypothetical protein
MLKEAVNEWHSAMTLSGDSELAAILTQTHVKHGFTSAVRAVARKRIERLERRTKAGEYVPSIYFARCYLRLDDAEQAFRWLEKACNERNAYRLMIARDPVYDPLKKDARFSGVLRRMESNSHEAVRMP